MHEEVDDRSDKVMKKSSETLVKAATSSVIRWSGLSMSRSVSIL